MIDKEIEKELRKMKEEDKDLFKILSIIAEVGVKSQVKKGDIDSKILVKLDEIKVNNKTIGDELFTFEKNKFKNNKEYKNEFYNILNSYNEKLDKFIKKWNLKNEE